MTAEFNSSYMNCFILMGYKYIQYHSYGDYAVLTPRKYLNDSVDSYQIPITDEQVLQMASGKVDLIPDFKFYVNVL